MRAKSSTQLLLALLPLLVGAICAAFVRHGALAGSMLQARLELDYGLLAFGALISAVLVWRLWSARANKNRIHQASAQARQQSRREHLRFTERLDHELKNPLTTINANLANLQAIETSPAAQTSIQGIASQLSRLVGLTDDLRKLAAFEATELNQELVDIAALFDELLALCTAAPVFKERNLTSVLPNAPWPVRQIRADEDLLQLALYNLLENAAKYSDPGDTIELRAVEDGNQVRLTVADTGIGLSTEDQQQMFDELFRGQHMGRDREGSGIGLTLVQRIVEKHVWRLDVASEQGLGTQITLVAPIATIAEI